MTRTCNFPISETRHCRQPIADDKPNCGRHKIDLSADQLGQNPTVYRKDDELHVWAGEPDDVYCLIHGDPVYQTLCQVAGRTPPCCVMERIEYKDEHGKPHRDDGPAVIEPDGELKWYQHGELHRNGGPAWVLSDGERRWYQYNQLHRDDGPAIIEADGTQVWYQRGTCHWDDGPAVIWSDGTRVWWQHGELHREDGPAIIRVDGT